MSATTGILSGAIALATLELALASKSGTAAYSGVIGWASKALGSVMDPGVPALRDRSTPSASTTAAPAAATSLPPPSTIPKPTYSV